MPSLTIHCDTKEKALLFKSLMDHIIETNLNVRIREEALDHLFKIYHQDPKNRRHISNLIRLNDLEIRNKIERDVSKQLRTEYKKRIEEISTIYKKRISEQEKFFRKQMQDIQRLVGKLQKKVNENAKNPI